MEVQQWPNQPFIELKLIGLLFKGQIHLGIVVQNEEVLIIEFHDYKLDIVIGVNFGTVVHIGNHQGKIVMQIVI